VGLLTDPDLQEDGLLLAVQQRRRSCRDFGKPAAGELESEMLNRGMSFDVIDWSEDQAGLQLEE
jgi:hypothetical protein